VELRRLLLQAADVMIAAAVLFLFGVACIVAAHKIRT
jgi:hypothetical protein